MDTKRRRFESRLPKSSATPRLIRLLVGLGFVLVFMYLAWQKAQEKPQKPDGPVPSKQEQANQERPAPSEESPEKKLPSVHVEPERVIQTQIKNAVIRNQDGKEVFRGTVDLAETLARIERGEKGSHGNDGSVFQNREKRLPKKPAGYYHEWVHPTPDQRGPGPQRIITGDDGEIYYTPDHYKTFQRLDEEAGQGGGRD